MTTVTATYRPYLCRFMTWLDSPPQPYPNTMNFEVERLGQITPPQVAAYLIFLAYGTSTPADNDFPTKMRRSSFAMHMKAISHFVPNQQHWVVQFNVGNPTKSPIVNAVIKEVRRRKCGKKGVLPMPNEIWRERSSSRRFGCWKLMASMIMHQSSQQWWRRSFKSLVEQTILPTLRLLISVVILLSLTQQRLWRSHGPRMIFVCWFHLQRTWRQSCQTHLQTTDISFVMGKMIWRPSGWIKGITRCSNQSGATMSSRSSVDKLEAVLTRTPWGSSPQLGVLSMAALLLR